MRSHVNAVNTVGFTASVMASERAFLRLVVNGQQRLKVPAHDRARDLPGYPGSCSRIAQSISGREKGLPHADRPDHHHMKTIAFLPSVGSAHGPDRESRRTEVSSCHGRDLSGFPGSKTQQKRSVPSDSEDLGSQFPSLSGTLARLVLSSSNLTRVKSDSAGRKCASTA